MDNTITAPAVPKSLTARRLGLTIAAVVMGAAATFVAAPSASAVGSSACNDSARGTWETVVSNVNLRNGPGTKYYSKGQLAKGTDIHLKCAWLSRDNRQYWYYGKVRTGHHKGTWGWTRSKYLAVAR